MFVSSILRRQQQQQNRRLLQKCFFSNNSKTTNHQKLRLFDKVLIANRGEIACRIIRTCQALEIPTVAVYSEADVGSLHVQMADESYLIGTGPSASDSYLLQDDILDLCLSRLCQSSSGGSSSSNSRIAIHPGYGFLSENADFAQAVQASDDNGSITFIGPPPKAIEVMGSKSLSKQLMQDAGVPTTPGYHGTNQDSQYLFEQARDVVGFPVLIKAVSGGGGKGMRLVWKEGDFFASLESCQRESLASFGDDSVILEKYLVNPRHIEVQVLADTHGNVVHLYERDCSLQRRHQKIIEEAPASDLSFGVRERLWEYGIQAAKAVQYESAGTVEFLLDTTTSGDVYFCEMNTRLQVEHPVTELITNTDLVEWQLRIAAGESLPSQDEITCSGHAFEARVYAETPTNHFLPATGTIWHHHHPATTATTATTPKTNTAAVARVDTGIQPGQDISVYYDPMISKLIVSGKNRDDALTNLQKALKQYQLAGDVPTNLQFLLRCAQHPTFGIAGACNTGFLEQYMDEILESCGNKQSNTSPLMYAASAVCHMLMLQEKGTTKNYDPWSSSMGSWRGGGQGARRQLRVFGTNTTEGQENNDVNNIVEFCSNADGSFDVSVPIMELPDDDDDDDGVVERFHIDGTIEYDHDNGNNNNNTCLSLLVNKSKRMKFHSFRKHHQKDGSTTIFLWTNQGNHHLPHDEYFGQVTFSDPYYTTASTAEELSGGDAIVNSVLKAPMPGKITRLFANVGDVVECGDVIIVMEAMKMEHSIVAPRDGVIQELSCCIDDIVSDGHALAIIRNNDDDDDDDDDAVVSTIEVVSES